MNSMTPIPPVASKEEILATKDHVLETFYPISPTIDLQEVNVYQELNDTGKSSRRWQFPSSPCLSATRLWGGGGWEWGSGCAVGAVGALHTGGSTVEKKAGRLL